MDELDFLVQVSNLTPCYTVSIKKSENKLTARCSCENGGVHSLCKHRLSILAGKDKWVVSSIFFAARRVLSWVA